VCGGGGEGVCKVGSGDLCGEVCTENVLTAPPTTGYKFMNTALSVP
jgi:hypothetical protein